MYTLTKTDFVWFVVDWKFHKYFDFKKIQILIFSPVDIKTFIYKINFFLVILGPDIYAERI